VSVKFADITYAQICLQITVRRVTRDVRRCGTPTFEIYTISWSQER